MQILTVPGAPTPPPRRVADRRRARRSCCPAPVRAAPTKSAFSRRSRRCCRRARRIRSRSSPAPRPARSTPRCSRAAPRTSSAPSRDMERVWANFQRRAGLSHRQLDDAEIEPALARGARVRRARCSQPARPCSTTRRCARCWSATCASRGSRARSSAAISRRSRSRRPATRSARSVTFFQGASRICSHGRACGASAAPGEIAHRSLDGERGGAVRVSARADRRRVLRRRLDAAPRAAVARDSSRRRPHARDRRARRATGSGAARRPVRRAAELRAPRRLHARHAVHGRPVQRISSASRDINQIIEQAGTASQGSLATCGRCTRS